MKPRLGQILLGIVLGLLPFLVPVLFFLALAPGFRGALDFTASLPLSLPGLALAALVFVLVCQGFLYDALSRRGRRTAALSLWLVYPLAILLAGGTALYREARVGLARDGDYAGREVVLEDQAVRHLVLMQGEPFDLGYNVPYLSRCNGPCLSALVTGGLDSLAVPTKRYGGGFLVYRLAHGPACVAAGKAEEAFEKVDQRYRSARAELERLAAERDAASPGGQKRQAATPEALEALEARYREQQEALERLQGPYGRGLRSRKLDSSVRTLMRLGYFDLCVTYAFARDHDYDVMIKFGADFRRPYGPCCQIAEIHEKRAGGPVVAARWEARNGEAFLDEYFALTDVVAKVTGRSLARELPRRPVEDIDAELARLAALLGQGAYIDRFQSLRAWTERVLFSERSRLQDEIDFHQDVSLSDRGIDSLVRIILAEEAAARAGFHRKVRYLLDDDSQARLASRLAPARF